MFALQKSFSRKSVIELKRWKEYTINRKKLLEDLIAIAKSNPSVIIPDAYFDNNREIIPLRFAFILNNKEVPYKAGASIVLNVHYEHYVENNSDEERIHLVIHGKKNKDFWSQVSEVPGI